MKTLKQSTLLLTGLLILATSCKKTELAPSAQKSVSTAVSQNASAAQPFNIQDNYDLSSLVLYDECTGENVHLSGTAHNVIHGVYNNNNKATFDFHWNLQGVKGVGETTGNTYVVTENYKDEESYKYENNLLTVTVMDSFKMNTAGSANNFYITFAVAYTYDFLTGTFTVKRDKFDSGCR
jgi:hypothetical protein